MDRNLTIIYEDTNLMVCSKAAGIAVQSRRAGEMDLEGMVRNLLIKRTGDRQAFLAPVHRLDQPVEGLVLFAKTRQTAAFLSEQFRLHMVQKYYLAIVDGAFEKREGTLTDWLKKAAVGNRSGVVAASEPGAKRAQLEYRVLAERAGHQLLEVHLLTGRHHQIRVQLQHAGHPIIGDACYHPDYAGKHKRCYPALCAYQLKLEHVFDKNDMQFRLKPSGQAFEEMADIIEQL